MASEQKTGVATNGTVSSQLPSFTVKTGLAQMLKGGVIMDVVNADQVSHVL
jgi:pyridoxal 5'-phosphate synthase pdxS subunit